jgi:hypothetical protein
MKQTAVEFISKGLFNILQEAEDNNILQVGTQNFKRYIEMFEEQAKEMEKQQIIDFANDLLAQNNVNYIAVPDLAEQYYNEQFKTK